MTYDEAVEFADSTKKYGSILGLESIRTVSYTHLTLPTKLEV